MDANKRMLFELEHNLKSKGEIMPVIEASCQAKEILKNRGFEQVVRDFNNARDITGYGEFSSGLFEGAELFPEKDYTVKYQEKHTVYPLGIGVIVPKNKWKAIAGKIHTESDGQSFNSVQFMKSIIHLDTLGFVIHSDEGDLETNIEHELMHIDNDLYSANNMLLRRINCDIRQGIENEIKRELIAYRNELTKKADEMAQFLANKRMIFYASWLSQYIPDPYIIAMTLMPLREKIEPAVKAMEHLVKEIPSSLLTPILFSIGSTPEEINSGKVSSVLDEIVSLSDFHSKQGLDLGAVKDKLRGKGY